MGLHSNLSRPSGARRAIFIAGVASVGLFLAACGSDDDTTRDESGAIVEEGELSAFSISVGDCLVGSAAGEVSGFDGVPCDQPHDNEVYHTFDLADGDFPGDAVMQTQATEACLAAFETYVGISYQESPTYDITWLSPTAGSWGQGDREIACLVNNLDGTQKVGSAEGTAQ